MRAAHYDDSEAPSSAALSLRERGDHEVVGEGFRGTVKSLCDN